MLLCTSSLTRQCDVFNASTPGHPPHPKSHTLTELVFLSTPPPPFLRPSQPSETRPGAMEGRGEGGERCSTRWRGKGAGLQVECERVCVVPGVLELRGAQDARGAEQGQHREIRHLPWRLTHRAIAHSARPTPSDPDLAGIADSDAKSLGDQLRRMESTPFTDCAVRGLAPILAPVLCACRATAHS